MLTDFTGADRVYIACGYTDLRRGVDGLAALVQQQFNLDPFTNTLLLFCGRRRDRIKALYWKETDLFCCTSVWSLVVFSGPERKRSQSPHSTAVSLAHGGLMC